MSAHVIVRMAIERERGGGGERERGPSLTSTNRVEGREEESLGRGRVGGRGGVRREGEGRGHARSVKRRHRLISPLE